MPLTEHPKLLALAVGLIALAIVAVEQPWAPRSSAPPAPADLPAHLAKFPAAADFRGATGWVGEPQDLVALRGKVVLVDFWTYSCINCIRTLPYVQAWHARYAADGLVVVGVHTPEFRFEHDAANVRAAQERHGLTYPTAQDNSYLIWNAYSNRYWPAKYLVDGYGRVRYQHFGEGAYAETEDQIRALLAEAGDPPGPDKVGESPEGPRFPGRSPELYAGEAQGADRVAIGNPEGYDPGRTIAYARPADVARDRIYLVGTWDNHDQDVTARSQDAAVVVRFRAGAANFVAGGAEGACVPVLLDGAAIPRGLAGRDVSEAACVPLDGARSYDFFAGPFAEHIVELKVPEGFALFTFAFSNETQETVS